MSQYILMSGASSGIGKAASLRLAENGFTVFAGALNEIEAQTMRREGRKGIVPVVLDVTRKESVEAALAQVRQTIGANGHLYALVNCAGVGTNAPLHVLEEQEIMAMINVNYVGGIMLTRAVLPLLKHGESRIVFITSALALMRTPIVQVYCSTKAGMEGFADALRVELVPVGIKVAIVEPGIIRTPMISGSQAFFAKLLLRMDGDNRRLYEPMMQKIVDMSADPKATSTTDVTSSAILQALTSNKPKIRYRAGKDAKAAAVLGSLPHGLQDFVQRKIFGI